jgi:hypothetical protein
LSLKKPNLSRPAGSSDMITAACWLSDIVFINEAPPVLL